MVVVVRTLCNDAMFLHDAARDAPNYGGRVPVDTAPGPAPVCRALKNSSHHLLITTMSCPMSARQRACRQPCPGAPETTIFSTVATVRSRLAPPRRHQETTMFSTRTTVRARLFHPRRHRETANQHNRGITSTTLSMYCNWRVSRKNGPWESASAPRQG